MDLFTYSDLATFAGATAATTVVIRTVALLVPLRRSRLRWLATVCGQFVVIGVNVALGHFSIDRLPLLVLNGMLVGISSLGADFTRGEGSR